MPELLQNKISTELFKGLEALDFTIHNGNNFFFTDENYDLIRKNKYSIYFSLEKAKELKAKAVLFKLFKDQPPKPQIFIYDFTQKFISERELGEIHRILWNTGTVPLIYIYTKTEIKIINCNDNPIDMKGEIQPKYLEEHIDLNEALINAKSIQSTLQFYSANSFINGAFWENEKIVNAFTDSNTAQKQLLESLTFLRKKLLNKKEFHNNKKLVNKLIIQCILIKYLEERKDINNSPVFPSDYFMQFNSSTNFCEILENGSFVDLCDSLEKKFNGKIFSWDKKSEINERNILVDTNIREIADFLYAKTDSKHQYHLWRLYSFHYLPIEVISNIYDHFLGENKKGKVYTPTHLAHFLLDETMPLNTDSIPNLDDFKILDPACGSGIFLVLAFKRLYQWWLIKNYKNTGEWCKPSSKALKQLIQNCIFGIDIDPEAVRIAVFSLSLSLCDLLSPPEIWNELRFEDLTTQNIITDDFFNVMDNYKEQFDVIIGNPPFISEFPTNSAKEAEKRRLEKRKPATTDKQLAFLFTEQSVALLKNESTALLCLVTPALFLYSNSKEYRRYMLTEYNIAQIIDFTHISDILFDKVDYPVLAIFIKKNDKFYNQILHLVIKRTQLNKQKICFEIDSYDLHYVERQLAIYNDFIWKCNFMGGGRNFNLIKQLNQYRKFKDFLKIKKENNGWKYGQGFQIGHDGKNSDFQLENMIYRNTKKFKKADYITGKPVIDVNFFTEEGIDKKGIYIEKEKYFSRPRDKDIYEPPHLLIKESLGNNSFPIELSTEYLAFKRAIFGIHSPESEISELEKIKDRFKKYFNLYSFFISCISNTALISRSEYSIKNTDIMNLPYPKNVDDLILTGTEKIIIDDVLNYIIKSKQQKGEQGLNRKLNKQDLKDFADIFCKTLNSVYQDGKKQFRQWKIIKTPNFICNSFIYAEDGINNIEIDESEKTLNTLNELIYHKAGESLYINKILRIYDKDILYLIKPDQLRYWLGSIALRDADITFSDLIDNGY